MDQEGLSKEESDAFHERLRFLLRDMSQSELSRRTGARVANVSRYMAGKKVPASFCIAVVRKLGVNPSWLLTGEGTPYLADVTAQTATTASNLLEIVEAMNAVARMRLGALAGKEHAQVLRQLNEALVRYGALRDTLNESTRPVFEQVLRDLDSALASGHLDRAEPLLKAAAQIAPLCDDPPAQSRFHSLAATLEFERDRFDAALGHMYEAIKGRLTSGSIRGQAEAALIFDLVRTLAAHGRLAEARDICAASVALCRQHGSDWDIFHLFRCWWGFLDVELGAPRQGFDRMQRGISRMPEKLRQTCRAQLLYAEVLCGTRTLEDALDTREPVFTHANLLGHIARWRGDGVLLKTLVERFVRDELLAPASFAGVSLRYLLAAFEKPPKSLLSDCDKALENVPSDGGMKQLIELGRLVFTCQIALVADEHAEAARRMMAAHDIMGALPADTLPRLMTRAIHYRNALMLTGALPKARGAALNQQARAFFERHTRAGYAIFEGMA